MSMTLLAKIQTATTGIYTGSVKIPYTLDALCILPLVPSMHKFQLL